MKLLSWNANGRVKDAWQRQLDRVLDEPPDVLALQEITLASYPAWSHDLLAADYSVASSIIGPPPIPRSSRRSGASTST